MCNLRYGFRLCTCSDFDGQPDWTLYRQGPRSYLDGMFHFADAWPDAKRQAAYLIRQLSKPDAFDWNYQPEEGDRLVLRDANANELWAIFHDGSWRPSRRDFEFILESKRTGQYYLYHSLPGPVFPT